jgi:hypothetical protein
MEKLSESTIPVPIPNETISIEEYRNHFFTEKEEWNNFYNPKRCSIEALLKIEVKQRGNGPDKKLYKCGTTESGPYYDPNSLHVHIWKNSKLIINFESEQNPNKSHIEFTNVKTGVFCCICHIKNRNSSFKWNRSIFEEQQEQKEIYVNRNGYSAEDHIENPKIFPIINIETEKFCEPNKRSILNWINLTYKVKYSINFTKIVYPISTYKSLYLWPWEFSLYKNLKLKFPNYKESVIFIRSEDEKFRSNYSFIE